MKILLLCFFALNLVGCATITHDSTQKIKIETVTQDGQAITDADCTVTNDFSTIIGKSGTVFLVHRSNKDTIISCVSTGKANATGTMISSTNAAMFGNILLGGAIGMMIDHTKGTAYNYPEWIRLVFGQNRAYDEGKATDGAVLLGELSNSVSTVTTRTASLPPKNNSTPQPEPFASGFARIEDVDAIPYLNENGREAYRNWLNKAPPKAFVISADGKFGETRSTVSREPDLPSDPNERAMKLCERKAKQPCKFYAINNSVVWAKPASPTSTAVSTSSPPAQAEFIASGFAHIDDVDAIPYLNNNGRNTYRDWLTKPTPKAFAISASGRFSWTSGLKPNEPDLAIDPSERALQICERVAKEPCKLYAVNNAVVWTKAATPATSNTTTATTTVTSTNTANVIAPVTTAN